jgi:SPX domain protein involved in polyphosphate accumulation
MRFSDELKFNAIDDWRPFYMNYSALKRIVYNNLKTSQVSGPENRAA